MDYTLRVLMYRAASQTRTQPITISEIADSYLLFKPSKMALKAIDPC